MTAGPAPDKPIFSYYGDDFTGSTDALEALALNGVAAVLFLKCPSDSDLAGFPDARAIGIAGDSRSRTPQWMTRELPVIFGRLQQIGAPIVQYKICSTFDSSPATGSIGRALEVGLDVFGGVAAPIVPAAPLLGRYVAFGNMFAADHGAIYRIDRHPTMSRHPVTPMDEGDLRLHLAKQTTLGIGLVDLTQLRDGRCEIPSDTKAIVFDGVEHQDTVRAARLAWTRSSTPQMFAIGSSGFTYGVLDYWRSEGWIPEPAPLSSPKPVDRILVLSGSCSPATSRQIAHAVANGFCGVPLDPAHTAWPEAQREAIDKLAARQSVILYSAHGPESRVQVPDRAELASSMGQLLGSVIRQSGVSRAVVAGGDTSSHAVQALNLTALTYAAPLARGAPLCRAHGFQTDLELVLKGGQVGADDFFERVKSWA